MLVCVQFNKLDILNLSNVAERMPSESKVKSHKSVSNHLQMTRQ